MVIIRYLYHRSANEVFTSARTGLIDSIVRWNGLRFLGIGGIKVITKAGKLILHTSLAYRFLKTVFLPSSASSLSLSLSTSIHEESDSVSDSPGSVDTSGSVADDSEPSSMERSLATGDGIKLGVKSQGGTYPFGRSH